LTTAPATQPITIPNIIPIRLIIAERQFAEWLYQDDDFTKTDYNGETANRFLSNKEYLNGKIHN
jgi:hypothetical protein